MFYAIHPNLQYIFSSEIRKDADACLAIMGAFCGTSKEKLHQELGLESLENRSWFRKLFFFFKVLKSKSPGCLYNIFPQRISLYITRNIEAVPISDTRHSICKNCFFSLQPQ